MLIFYFGLPTSNTLREKEAGAGYDGLSNTPFAACWRPLDSWKTTSTLDLLLSWITLIDSLRDAPLWPLNGIRQQQHHLGNPGMLCKCWVAKESRIEHAEGGTIRTQERYIMKHPSCDSSQVLRGTNEEVSCPQATRLRTR